MSNWSVMSSNQNGGEDDNLLSRQNFPANHQLINVSRQNLPANHQLINVSRQNAAAGNQDDCSNFLLLDFFRDYYMPIMICVGLVGNLLSCVVFLRTHLKVRSSSYYLAALATADFGFNVTLLLVWLSGFGLRVFNADGWCQGVVYFSSVCSFLSVWLIVAFTVERFIAVQYPLHRPHMCTVERAKAVVSLLAALSLLLNGYSLFTAGVRLHEGEHICDMNENYREAMRVINAIDTILTLIVPLVLIVIMNTMITRNLLKFGKRLQQQDGTGNGSVAAPPVASDFNLNQVNQSNGSNKIRCGSQQSSFHSSQNRPSSSSSHVQLQQMQPIAVTARLSTKSNDNLPHITRCIHIRSSKTNLVSIKTQQSITKMLLLISTVFVLLNLPSYVIRLYIFVRFSLWREQTTGTGTGSGSSLWCLQQVFMLLYYTHFSINFLLYSMCGVTFRRFLWQLMRNKLKALSRHFKCKFLRQRGQGGGPRPDGGFCLQSRTNTEYRA
ncbi:uncharacterized protein LOC111059972 [Nilaparvata lugens]|uniref:uncharacterized protein LOC111059972 n=1 Tax=Nilaparvata lugens TaxID=108931 RepID=UPI00193D28AC|nr:uncharacterized protein LOC111059972 [Nilaparvata lugens]